VRSDVDSLTQDMSSLKIKPAAVPQDACKAKQALALDQTIASEVSSECSNRKRVMRGLGDLVGTFKSERHFEPGNELLRPRLEDLSTKKRCDLNFIRLQNSRGQVLQFNLYRDQDLGLITEVKDHAGRRSSLEENLIESVCSTLTHQHL
jgi:hypothetical protein